MISLGKKPTTYCYFSQRVLSITHNIEQCTDLVRNGSTEKYQLTETERFQSLCSDLHQCLLLGVIELSGDGFNDRLLRSRKFRDRLLSISEAGLRTLHDAGPELKRAISGNLEELIDDNPEPMCKRNHSLFRSVWSSMRRGHSSFRHNNPRKVASAIKEENII